MNYCTEATHLVSEALAPAGVDRISGSAHDSDCQAGREQGHCSYGLHGGEPRRLQPPLLPCAGPEAACETHILTHLRSRQARRLPLVGKAALDAEIGKLDAPAMRRIRQLKHVNGRWNGESSKCHRPPLWRRRNALLQLNKAI